MLINKINQQLKSAREKVGWNPTEAGIKAGTCSANIHHLEKDGKGVSKIAIRYAETLGYDVVVKLEKRK